MLNDLSCELVKRLFHYEPTTGAFTWAGYQSSKSRIEIGSPAGSYSPKGYLLLSVGRKHYLASRVAFLYMTGAWPTKLMDHIDRNPRNNAWSNLREVTRSENNRNKGTHPDKTSKFRGVSKRQDKWLVVIRVNGKPKYMGQYKCEQEAGRIAAPYFADIAP